MRAFTLIEVLVYIALFALLMSGLTSAVMAMQATASRNDTLALVLEEGIFLEEILAHAADDGSLDSYRLTEGALVTDTARISGNQVRITDFIRTRITPQSPEPPYRDISFTVSAYASGGSEVSHTFSEQIYILWP